MYQHLQLTWRKHLLLMFALLFVCSGFGQQYGFQQYSVSEGLAQSQPTVFAQNKSRQLFIGTLGGMSVFDGKDFTNFSKAQGLLNNVVTTLALDSAQHLWIGTNVGISKFDGRRFLHYFPNEKETTLPVNQLVVDGENKVWALVGQQLYSFQENRFLLHPEMDSVFCLTVDRSGKLWAFKYKEGLMVMGDGGAWHLEVSTAEAPDMLVFRMEFGRLSGSLYCTSSKGIKTVEKGRFVTPDWARSLPDQSHISYSVFEDKKGNKWVGKGSGGVWCRRKNNWIHYHFDNGFTNEAITDIFEDSEGNLWFASDGSGIFKFTGNVFTLFDRTSDFSSSNVMAVTQQQNGTLYFAGSNRGFFRMAPGGEINPLKLPDNLSRINTMFTDREDVIWLGTDVQGLWQYKQDRYRPYPGTQDIFGITHLEPADSGIWISSLNGLYRIEGRKVEKIRLPFPVHTSLSVGRDTLLLGTFKGAYIWNIRAKTLSPEPVVNQANILCLAANDVYVFIGTDDRGVVAWDRKNNKLTSLNQQKGLSCDYVYSLLLSSDGDLWVGTGCGIDRISRKRNQWEIEKYGESAGIGLENNNSAAFEDQRGMLWFGTTQGVFRYNPYADEASEKKITPRLILTEVKLFSKDLNPMIFSGETLPFSSIPVKPLFKPKENHLTFTFKAISLRYPGNIKYRYQLVGADPVYTETQQTTVIYPNLPPGEYVFKVWASDAAGNWYDNALSYPFTINTPYFATWYFRIGLAFLSISLFLGVVYLRNRQKARRMAWAQELKEDARARVRQKIAEDFHDEIGNKLTRINLLITVMKRKLGASRPEIGDMLEDIRKNVSSLYQGSRDIIWSLQPQSYFLDEVLFHIKENTLEMLEGSGIAFQFQLAEISDPPIRLEGEYPRNLIMIFKEAVNNIVKHSTASRVEFIVKKEKEALQIILKDNGKGMPSDAQGNGNGLKNMKNRASRIKGELKWLPNEPQGTIVVLKLDWKKLKGNFLLKNQKFI